MYTRLQRAWVLCAVLMAVGAVFPMRSAEAATPSPFRYFKETGHNIAMRVKVFYEAKGDVAVFGLPLTEVIMEDGIQVQYFERARFELRPDLPDAHYITLSQLGRRLAEGRTEAAFAALPGPTGQGTFFKQTGHTINAGFLEFWQKRGGLPIFGLPLSEEFTEYAADGTGLTVQYFERARFEYHADAPAGQQVKLSLLGREALDRSAVPASARQAAPAVTMLSTATTGYFGSFAERVNNIARGAARMNGMVVQPGATFSFGNALGPAGEANGFVDGYAIVNGRLEKVTGGGLCQVSTTMYRAVFYAGLQVVNRVPHSYMINFYENIKGFDATIFTPSVDFKWRNDTGGPVYIFASTNPNKATVTFSLYGFNDGRQVQMVGPVEKNVVQPGKPYWQYDPTLKRGEIRQIVHGRPGSEISMQRVIRNASGKVIRTENFPSKYRPWEDFYLYGAGVKPPAGVNIVPPNLKASSVSHP